MTQYRFRTKNEAVEINVIKAQTKYPTSLKFSPNPPKINSSEFLKKNSHEKLQLERLKFKRIKVNVLNTVIFFEKPGTFFTFNP